MMQTSKYRALITLLCGPFLATCSSTVEPAPVALPILVSANFTTVDKPKIDLSTPNGTKQIYDPVQDPDVRLAFEGFVQAKQKSGYFKGWPSNFVKRWNPRPDIQKNEAIWKEFRANNPLIDEYNKIIGGAKKAQYNDHIRAGCSAIQEVKLCYSARRIGYDFERCSENQTNWGDFKMSECEAKTLNHYDQIGTIATRYIRPKPPVTPDDFCLYSNHLGEPKRGPIEDQFEDYFAISCTKFKD